MAHVNFGAFKTDEQYKENIDSPSRCKRYFLLFHKPLVDNLLKKSGSGVKIIDIACGPAHELKYFRNDEGVKRGNVEFAGVDLSPKMLELAQANAPFASYRVVDVSKANAVPEYHGVMATNAMIYCPDKMASYAFDSLLPGGSGVINFMPYDDERNSRVIENYRKNGYAEITTSISVGSAHFTLKGIDCTKSNEIVQAAGMQFNFKNKEDIAYFLEKTGFVVRECQEFLFSRFEDLDLDFLPGVHNADKLNLVFSVEKPAEKKTL